MIVHKKRARIWVYSFAIALLAFPAAAASLYTVTDLDMLGETFSAGQGVNKAGQVTGFTNTTGKAAPDASEAGG